MSACGMVYLTLTEPPVRRCGKRGRLSGQPCAEHERALRVLEASERTWTKYLALVAAFEEWEEVKATKTKKADYLVIHRADEKLRKAARA